MDFHLFSKRKIFPIFLTGVLLCWPLVSGAGDYASGVFGGPDQTVRMTVDKGKIVNAENFPISGNSSNLVDADGHFQLPTTTKPILEFCDGDIHGNDQGGSIFLNSASSVCQVNFSPIFTASNPICVVTWSSIQGPLPPLSVFVTDNALNIQTVDQSDIPAHAFINYICLAVPPN